MPDHFNEIDFGELQIAPEIGELVRRKAEIIPFFTKVDNGFACLSQWHTSYFTVDGVDYCTAEQYMMHAKARLFGDTEMAERILKVTAPHDHKRLGQNARGFDSQIWVRERCRIAFTGNLAKFSQSKGLRKRLLRTEGTILAEANPKDSIWGIGMAYDDPDLQDTSRWRGMNLLGHVLTMVRERLLAASRETCPVPE
ncbi:MAG: NADAR family protein [Dichotomicrobium sp.]